MRDRLIAAFVGLAVLTIALFVVVRAYSVSATLEESEQVDLRRSVDLMAGLVVVRVGTGDTVNPTFLRRQLTSGENLVYSAPGGRTIEATTDGYDSGTGKALEQSRTISGGGELTLSRSTAGVEARVAEVVLQLVLLGILLVGVAVVLGVLAARHLSRPFQDLARLAGEFGRGRFDVEVPHYSIPEAEEIGTAMREAQREVTGLIGREREFAANASHQLKTPITALKLGLEDLALWPQTHPDVAAELTRGIGQLDRLSVSVHDLLELARGRRVDSAQEIDLCALIVDTAERWRPRVSTAKRELVTLAPGQIAVRMAPGPVAKILDILIDNALQHGRGVISITVLALDTHVRVQVSDQGKGGIDDEVFRRKLDVRLLAADSNAAASRGNGISLSVATEVAEAMGGYLRLEPVPSSTLVLMIPRSRPPT